MSDEGGWLWDCHLISLTLFWLQVWVAIKPSNANNKLVWFTLTNGICLFYFEANPVLTTVRAVSVATAGLLHLAYIHRMAGEKSKHLALLSPMTCAILSFICDPPT